MLINIVLKAVMNRTQLYKISAYLTSKVSFKFNINANATDPLTNPDKAVILVSCFDNLFLILNLPIIQDKK